VIKPEIESFLSVDLELNGPLPDPEDCAFAFEVAIGPKSEEGPEFFQFTVITPKFLIRESSTSQVENARWDRGCLILDRFSWHEVERSLEKLLLHCRKKTWSEVAYELNKEMRWEFENYQEHSPG